MVVSGNGCHLVMIVTGNGCHMVVVVIGNGCTGSGCHLTSYLIFVTNAANAVRVKFLAECKKIQKNEKITVLGSIYIITVIM